jgi:hypothetical protein
VNSDRLAVSPPKSFPGMMESTFLSRSFADQGVKLRIRKEPRTMMYVPYFTGQLGPVTDSRRKRTRPEDFPPAVPARSPERQPVQIPPATGYGGYPPSTRDYSYYGPPPVKRHRTSIDYGRQQGIYDAEGRMPYSQPATAIYTGQPGTYQPPMQSYATGQVMPDYSVSITPAIASSIGINVE